MNPQLVDATDLNQLSDRLEARGLLPHLVRRLLANAPGVTRLVLPAEEGIAAPGYDGRVDGGAGSAWVPAGLSVWEMGANQDPRAKAQADYDTRTNDPGTAVPKDTVFVFVTSRRWAAGQDWAEERRKEKVWRDVVVLDAEGLHGWLEQAPDVHVWISERLDRIPLRIKTLERAFEQIALRTQPPLPPQLLLAGRAEQARALIEALTSPARAIAVQAGSREEALAFVAAVVEQLPASEDIQPLVVSDSEVLARLALSDTPLILVLVSTEGAEVGDTVARDHRVVLALGAGDHASEDAIVLPRPERMAAAEALIAAGVPWETAHRHAGLARRSFSALQRDMSVSPGGARPAWAAGDDAPLLCALLLLGGWGSTEGDADVVAAVTGLDRATVESRLLTYVGSEDPPWARSAGGWNLVSPEDGWTLLHHLLTEGVLATWQAQALVVLGEVDPRLGFDAGQRMLADIKGEHVARHSERLRDGMAQAAALLSGRGARPSPTGLVAASFSITMIERLLRQANTDASGGLWSSLSNQLPSLAEAAPDGFLDALAEGLAIEPSPVLAMFTDTPHSSPITSPSSPHTGLLWALEGVAWSPDHVVRTVLLLGELAARAPEGRLANRPDSSLRSILLPWYPQTGATPEQRLDALDALREREPAVAWKLELLLLPMRHGSASPTHRPRFRDWTPDHVEPSDPDETHVTALAGRVGQDAGQDPHRWAEALPMLRGLPSTPRLDLLDRIGALDPEAMASSARLVLWRALVDEGETHRHFTDAAWSLGDAYAEHLLTLAERFEDPDPPERHARLFDYRVHMPDVARDDHAAQREAVAAAQQAAATDVYDRGGLEALTRLASASKLPRAVGWAHAGGREDADSDALRKLLGNPGAAGLMAAGWAARRAQDAGPTWVEAELARLSNLPVEAQATFMLQIGPTRAIWEHLDRLDPDVQERYWQGLDAYAVRASDLTFAVERMLDHGRPWGAIDALSGSVHDGREIDIDLADRALKAAAASENVNAAVDAGFEVGQVLDAMERSGAEAERLATHEFVFFALLDHERQPRALTAAVADNPQFFVDLVRHAYTRGDGTREEDVRMELASHAWQVLEGLSRVPGSGEAGLDRAKLRSWVQEVRTKLAEADRGPIGDEQIGQLLARAPAEPGDVWPPRAVRDLVEELGSEHIEEGIENGHVKARGVTMRGVYDGGRQERGIAADLRRDAAALDVQWRRTARMLRSLASTYEGFATREDRDAQRAADED